MDKILVNVYIPSIRKKYDVYIPLNSRLHEVIDLITKGFNDIEQGCCMRKTDSILCDFISGSILDINKSVKELNLINGSKLILI